MARRQRTRGTRRDRAERRQARPEPESIALTNLLSEPLKACDKSTRILIDAQEEPKKFLKHMTTCLRGSYFWAEEVEA